MRECSFSELVGMKTLIVGDVGTGKTVLTRCLLLEAVNHIAGLITVLDFAPPAQKVKGIDVGGYLLEESHPKIKSLYSRLMKTPRLSAKDSYEVIRLASYNREITESLITKFLDSYFARLFSYMLGTSEGCFIAISVEESGDMLAVVVEEPALAGQSEHTVAVRPAPGYES